MDAITARELVTAVSGKLIKGNENEFVPTQEYLKKKKFSLR